MSKRADRRDAAAERLPRVQMRLDHLPLEQVYETWHSANRVGLNSLAKAARQEYQRRIARSEARSG